jgi:ubiquinone/menaquinone biosynthesis C-methylase UbiE
MKKENTEKILSDLERGYDTIAGKFSSTRAFMWRDLGFIKDLVKPGDRVLDFGCGNGRLAGFLDKKYKEYVGADISQKLIDIAKQRYNSEKTKFIKIGPTSKSSGRATKKGCGRTSLVLFFEENYFDIIFSIAVFHHFPSSEYALEIIKELRRVLKPGGKIVVTVWNLWQKQYLKFHQESNGNWARASIPFRAGENIFYRYHHPFQKEELVELLEKSGFKIQNSREDWNITCIASKG